MIASSTRKHGLMIICQQLKESAIQFDLVVEENADDACIISWPLELYDP